MYVKSNWFFIPLIRRCWSSRRHTDSISIWRPASGAISTIIRYSAMRSASFISLRRWCSTSGGWTRGCHTVTWRPRAEGAVVFCITVTFLIYHFIPRPEAFRMGNGGKGSFYSVLNMVQHYIVPLMALLDWLLFCPKGRWRRYAPALLAAYPAGLFHLYPHPGTVRRQHRRSVKPLSLQFHRHTGARSGHRGPECAARGPRHVRARLPDVFHRPRPVAAGQADEAYASERAGLTVPFGLRLPDTCRRYTVGRFCFSERRGVPSGRI